MKKLKVSVAILIAFILIILIVPATLLVGGFALPSKYDQTFLGEMKYKVQRLKETTGKRIIIIGGSSVAFGLKSQLIEQYLPDYTAINFGLYGELGTKFMLDVADDYIHDGDIIIISPEQNNQTLSLYFNGSAVWQAADGDFDLINYVASSDKENLIGNFPQFATKKLSYALSGKLPQPDEVYRRSSFNEYGDICYENRTYNIMTDGYDQNNIICFNNDVADDDFLDYMNSFYKTAFKKGASVYYRFSPMNKSAIEEGTTESDIDAYFTYLQSKLKFPIIGNPHNSIFSSEYFYDTNFHLNDSGAIINTKRLIQDIKVTKKDSSVTDIEEPVPPSKPAEIISTSDNTDDNCFIYQQVDGGFAIVGLTDEGALKQSLVIPFSHENQKVLYFTQGTFADNKIIEKVTIQSNIGFIYDNSFEGCSAFKQLIILNDTPTSLSVGDNLIGSADFNIYVNEDVVDAYKLNYVWGKYALNIFSIK